MALVSVTRTTNGMDMAGGVAGFYTQLNALLLAMMLNKPIKASDTNSLKSLIALWDSHTHSVSDMTGIDTFGNLPTYGGGTVITSTSQAVKGATPPSLTVTAGSPITASNHNVLRQAVEYFRAGHTHTITDTIS